MKLDMETQDFGLSEIEIAGPMPLPQEEGWPTSVVVAGMVTVDNLGSRFLLSGKIAASGHADCSRCLESFSMKWSVPVEITVLRDTHSEEEEGETLVIQQRKGVVDLSDAVNECTVLALPQTSVCSEDCKGLCSQCGIDKNKAVCDCIDEDFDPRWEGLPD
jgi:uncharacterized protein